MNAEKSAGTHHGMTIAEYREKKAWTQEELAHALKVHPRTVQRWEEKAMIKDTSRRRFIAGVLGIPVALLGLEPLAEIAKVVQKASADDRLNFYEEALAM
ncbi:MAG: helix-turn-helix transcriptional regulator [Ktedonobacteraceae bacterium]|nr:helix-turn-helix transcriptional regulator [Ktedonobacteraceae bacterium]MBA3824321.1 helix-turn-helix transcriptional regulator [Ktedonobacterales bacterium]